MASLSLDYGELMSDTILEQWVLALAPVVLQQAINEDWPKMFPDDWRERVSHETWKLADIMRNSRALECKVFAGRKKAE